ncbi:histidyl-tRNA synthetase, putative [Theileria equi strain WA]|uniref:histidine--tRNA ligase n=1 Tax=Theileria equi strain WA TaxID=1537102 RepID=L0AWB9_THEEQ|nr:histidyl-tRNA synthetase, putative [Theileria equi strain WA]AFZ79326.1 histidyl-tRNA synthetase, putative [Theileria equi strain WA]|eukprot:XP_004828992.1 histidyl-tRNA synthetase, putative [Theileria equi strain WA]
MIACIIFTLYISICCVVESFFVGRSSKLLSQSSLVGRHCNYLKYNLSYKNEILDTVRGAQCYLPGEQRIQRWIQEKWKELSEDFGFQEYSMSVLAPTKIFENANTSEDNEHFKELYTFKDAKGRNISLRGDATPQFMWLIRRFIDDEPQLPSNITKFYAISDCWRYERPSYCRRRNHTQWNLDIIGIATLDAEIELIYMLISFLKSVGFSSDDLYIHLNHKDSTSALLKLLGISEYTPEWLYKFQKTLDKYKRISENEFFESLINIGLTHIQCSRLRQLISTCLSISDIENIFGESGGFVKQLRTIYNGLSFLGISDWIKIDLTIVRGNDYYTGLVFECFDRHNISQRAIAGGGRYDKYFGEAENDERLKFAVGLGMGNIGIINLLKERNLVPKHECSVDIVVHIPPIGINIESNQRSSLLSLVRKLRDNNIFVYQYYKSAKLKKALEYADKCAAKFIISPMPDEESFLLKDLGKNKQEVLTDTKDIADVILERLNNYNT